MRRRVRLALLLVAAALAVLVALVLVGRWERQRHARAENALMLAVYRAATSNGLISPRLRRYRLDYLFDCLLYSPPGRPDEFSAYEICFDGQGRLVQTIDRHAGTPHFGSLLEQRSLATFSVPVPRLVHLFRTLGVFEDPNLAGRQGDLTTLPTITHDATAKPFPRPPDT